MRGTARNDFAPGNHKKIENSGVKNVSATAALVSARIQKYTRRPRRSAHRDAVASTKASKPKYARRGGPGV
jgi:hypothetical protein